MDRMKKAGRMVVDSGAKTMLKTDIIFLQREIKSRKQRFGVEVYELMESLEVDSDLTIDEKEGRIRLAFDRARKDIAVVQAKIDCKQEEMTILEEESAAALAASNSSGPSSHHQPSNHVIMTGHPSDM